MKINKKYLVLILMGFLMLLSFQNCGNINLSLNTPSLTSLSIDSCPHPTGDFPSDPNIAVQLFRDANICSNLGESCQSAFFRCEKGTWTADSRNPSEKIEFFTYRTCLSQFCQPPIPPPDCPNPLPEFQCGQWGPWSNQAAQCGSQTRTCTRTLPSTCTEPTSTTEENFLTCPIPPPACPDPLPAFQCGEWSAWSKPSGLCGTRTRNCTRTLPATCTEPTTQPQTETLSCETAPPGTISFGDRCNVFSQYVPQCQPNSAINLQDTMNGAWVYVALPSGNTLSIPIDPNMNYSGMTGYAEFGFSATQGSCAATMIELSISNRNGVIMGTRKDGTYGEVAANLLVTDDAYSTYFPNNPSDQADYQHCYTRAIAPSGMAGGTRISYAVTTRPDDLMKRAACVIDPAQGPWFLNVRYSYPVPRLIRDTNITNFTIPAPPYCAWGLR